MGRLAGRQSRSARVAGRGKHVDSSREERGEAAVEKVGGLRVPVRVGDFDEFQFGVPSGAAGEAGVGAEAGADADGRVGGGGVEFDAGRGPVIGPGEQRRVGAEVAGHEHRAGGLRLLGGPDVPGLDETAEPVVGADFAGEGLAHEAVGDGEIIDAQGGVAVVRLSRVDLHVGAFAPVHQFPAAGALGKVAIGQQVAPFRLGGGSGGRSRRGWRWIASTRRSGRLCIRGRGVHGGKEEARAEGREEEKALRFHNHEEERPCS